MSIRMTGALLQPHDLDVAPGRLARLPRAQGASSSTALSM